jgi:hypothetical protein
MRFRHSGHAGDVIYSLPTIKAFLAGTDRAELYLRCNIVRNPLTPNGHPLGDLLLNEDYAHRLIPLIGRQAYVRKCAIWTGEAVDVDLDEFRKIPFVLQRGTVPRFYSFRFPVCPRLWEPWLEVDADSRSRGAIVVNRTPRRHNPEISYRFLSAYRPVYFIGLPEEYSAFHREVPSAEYLPDAGFLQAGQVIAGSRLFIGNSSCCFAIAEGLKVRRLLEVNPRSPNVVPSGPGGHDFIRQDNFESLVGKLLEED